MTRKNHDMLYVLLRYMDIFLLANNPNNRRDGPDGTLRPASHASTVFKDTPKYWANNDCVSPT